MPITIARIGTALGGAATEFEIARHPDADGPHFLTVRRAGGMTHSYRDLLADGGLFETPVQTKPGGLHLALAAYDAARALNIHATAGQKLRFEVYETGGFFDLEADKEFTTDTEPWIVPFGAEAPPPVKFQLAGPGLVLAPVARAELRPRPARAPRPAPAPGPGPGPGGSGTPGNPDPDAPVTAVTGITISIGPKIGRAIVGSLTTAGQLRLTLWGFDAGGEIRTQLGKWAEILAGPAQSFFLAKVKEHWSANGKFVTAVDIVAALRDSAGKLRLQRWRLTMGTQSMPTAFTKLSEVAAPETITSVSCCAVEALGGIQLVTAVRMSNVSSLLKVIAWKMEPGGGMTRLAEATAGGISTVYASSVRGRIFVTATRESDERFKANYWRFPGSDTGPIEALGNAAEGKIDNVVRCIHIPGEGAHVGDTIFAAREQKDSKLRLWRYQVTE